MKFKLFDLIKEILFSLGQLLHKQTKNVLISVKEILSKQNKSIGIISGIFSVLFLLLELSSFSKSYKSFEITFDNS